MDQFEPGDARATSGGESRLIRCGHGPDAFYTASARRARTLWRELEAECGEDAARGVRARVVRPRRGRLRGGDDGDVRRAGDPVRAARARGGRARCYPSFDPGGLAFLLHEPEAGVLRAQRAVAGARAPGGGARRHGAARQARRPTARACASTTAACWRATPSCGRAGRGSAACSPSSSRSARPGRSCSSSTAARPGRRTACPPTSTSTGRSTARATSTASASRPRPTSTARRSTPTPRCPPRRAEGEALARAFLAERFPALADAPLSGSKCCRYELTPDAHFVAAPHPEHALRLAARRRLGPRLQARPGDRRAASPRRSRGGAAAAREPVGLAGRGAGGLLRTAGATVRGGVGSAPCTTT